MKRALTLLAEFGRAREGVSAVEFALIAPVMVAMYLGSAELTQLLTADRKVTGASNVVADLVAQDDFVTDNDLADVYEAGEAVLAPYDGAQLALRITSVRMNADGEIFVDWSEGRGLQPIDTDDLPDLPEGLLAPMNSIVMVEAQYVYSSPLKYNGDGWTLTDTAYMRPRRSPWVRRG
ncbi:MAG: TadE/TadG family type IV pilus assembly protein [Oceanicaulis sp.]